VVDTRSGKALWHLDASGGATVARNVVYQHKEHSLDAYDGRTGHLLWSIPEGTQLTVLSKGIIRIDGEGRAALYTALPSR